MSLLSKMPSKRQRACQEPVSHFKTQPAKKPLSARKTKSNRDLRDLTLSEPQSHDGEGEDCELHVYEERFDTRGQKTLLRVGTKTNLNVAEDKSPRACLVVIRRYSYLKELVQTSLEVRSPYVRKALRDVVKAYPGVAMNSTGRIVIHDEPRCLFHYQDEVRAYVRTYGHTEMERHVELCLQYMTITLRKEVSIYDETVEKAPKNAGLEHQDLWMAYKPGAILYEIIDGKVALSRLLSMEFREGKLHNRERNNQEDFWELDTKVIRCQGSAFQYCSRIATIYKYEGSKPFTELHIFPLNYHVDHQRIRDDLISRGRKFTSLLGIHYQLYDGRIDSSGDVDAIVCIEFHDKYSH